MKIDQATEDVIAADLAEGMSLRNAAKKHDVTTWIIHQVKKKRIAPTGPPQAREWIQEGDKATCNFTTDQLVRGEADAIRLSGLDTNRWRVVRMWLSNYQTAMKLRKGKDAPEEEKIVQLTSVKLELALILPEPYLDATEALFKRLEAKAPRFAPVASSLEPAPCIAEIDLFDVHFGKLSWLPEAGENYDLRIAEAIFLNAVEDLLSRISGYRPARFVLPLGNDLFHIDTIARTTTSGTPVDCDSRYHKMIEIGEAAVLRAVERLQEIAPVDVIHVPGNHDRLASWHLCRLISAWFRHSDRVTVDVGPADKKYRRYGVNLFGYIHGDKVPNGRLKSLPVEMAVERKEDWAATSCREWKLGHQHTRKEYQTQSSDEFSGVVIRKLSSLSATDAYHAEWGYIGNRRAAEVYLYDMMSGYIGHFCALARTA